MEKTKYLAHFGIPGMKWGQRHFQNEDGTLTPEGKARYGVKEAKKELKAIRKSSPKIHVLASREKERKLDSYRNKVRKAKFNVLDKKAELGFARKGEKGERRQYIRAMKRTGIPGSAAGYFHGNQGTRLYDHIAAKKGEQYAKAIEKQTSNELIATAGVSLAAGVGLEFLRYYLDKNY